MSCGVSDVAVGRRLSSAELSVSLSARRSACCVSVLSLLCLTAIRQVCCLREQACTCHLSASFSRISRLGVNLRLARAQTRTISPHNFISHLIFFAPKEVSRVRLDVHDALVLVCVRAQALQRFAGYEEMELRSVTAGPAGIGGLNGWLSLRETHTSFPLCTCVREQVPDLSQARGEEYRFGLLSR